MEGDEKLVDRRTVLQAVSGVAVSVGIAGCTNPENEGDEDATDDQEGDAQPGGEPTTTEPEEGEEAADGGDDETSTVLVGPEENFVFDPGTNKPLNISTGTTVAFVWQSDTHNIVVESQPDGASWEGHEDIENDGFEYEHTFETPGEYQFYCEPHQSAGMEGTIIVEE